MNIWIFTKDNKERNNMAEVTPFQFDKDKYEQTKEIYISILASLGVENPEGFLEAKISLIKL